MAQENSHGLSYISRGASLLAVLGVLTGGVLAYAQTATEAKVTIWAYKDLATAVPNIQIQQILTGAEKTAGAVKESCVSKATGQCTFVISEKDGEVHFIGAEIDKETGKAVEQYGHEIEPNYGCLRVTFKYDPAAGKIYQYVDGVKKDSVNNYTIFAESFYTMKCVPNAKGGYDWVNKNEVKSPEQPKPSSPPPGITFTTPDKKPEAKKPSAPISAEDDFEDVEDAESDAGNADIALSNVTLISKKLQKKKKTRSLGLRFSVAAESDTTDTLTVRASMNCTLKEGYPNNELWQTWDFPVARLGSQQIFYEFGAEDEKWNALKKKKPFTCYAAISGIVPADAPLELHQDADASNNRLRFKLFWSGGRWQISKPEIY